MITPLALLGLLVMPIIVAFYMLRLRRRDVRVGSTFLWQQLVRDVEANAPWQRLRFSWLLLLQLLLALLVVLAATRPFATVETRLSGSVVLILDSSASMATQEVEGPRMGLARDAARRIVDELPEGGRITVVAADDTAHVLVAETEDRAAALEAIAGVEATQLPGDLTDAFALASALAARDSDASVVVVSDANVARLPAVGIGAPVHVERVGTTDANQAIAALSVARRAGGAQLDVFVAVANPSSVDVTRRLELYVDGEDQLVDAREITVPAGERAEVIVSTVPATSELVLARLAGSDALAIDDVAAALVPVDTAIRTLLVSDGNAYLENALALLPRLELYAVGASGFAAAIEAAEEEGEPYGLIVTDRLVPAALPRVPVLFVGPPSDGAFGGVGPALETPALAPPDPNEPLLRYVDLSALHIGRARSITLSEGMRPIVETATGDPLIAAGRVDGLQTALIAFELGESDLPLQVAFPLLMSNLVDFLLPPAQGALPPSLRVGEPVSVTLDPRLERVILVDRPMDAAGDEATEVELPVVGGSVTLPGASASGIRELRSDHPDLGGLLGRTAVNLFDVAESAVAPGDPQRLIDMGRVSSDTGSQELARAEWWWPLVVAALALLALEWIVFHRPTRRSTQRAARRLLTAARMDR